MKNSTYIKKMVSELVERVFGDQAYRLVLDEHGSKIYMHNRYNEEFCVGTVNDLIGVAMSFDDEK